MYVLGVCNVGFKKTFLHHVYTQPHHPDISGSSVLSFHSSCSSDGVSHPHLLVSKLCCMKSLHARWFNFMPQAFTPPAVTHESQLCLRAEKLLCVWVSFFTYCYLLHCLLSVLEERREGRWQLRLLLADLTLQSEESEERQSNDTI